jgi:hypothetical protein
MDSKHAEPCGTFSAIKKLGGISSGFATARNENRYVVK